MNFTAEAIGVAAAAFLIPLFLSWTLTRVMMAIGPKIGLVDQPSSERKFHRRATPMGGGVAIYAAIALTMGIVVAVAWLEQVAPAWFEQLPESVRTHASGVQSQTGLLALIIAAASIQMLVGLTDDYLANGLSAEIRLLIEVTLVVGLISQGICLSLFTDVIWVTGTLTVLWVVGLTNALNFLDNADALSGGVALLASLFFAATSLMMGDLFVAGCFWVTVGGLIGFLRYNWNPAKIFMGDAGSNFIGFWLGTLTIVATFNRPQFSHVTIFAPLCILAVPIYDSTSVILLRILQGRSPFSPDRQHFSHRLMDLGLSTKNAVCLIYLVTVTTGLSGVMLFFITPSAAPLVVAQVACVLAIIALLEIVAHRRSRALTRAAEGNAKLSETR